MSHDVPAPGPFALLPGLLAALGCGALASGGLVAKVTVAGLLVVPCAASSYLAASARADEEAARRRLITGSLAATLAVVALSLFAGVLKATTHHRALGGTTFAVAGALVGVGCLALGWRVSGLLARARWKAASMAVFGLGLLAMGWALHRAGMVDLAHLDAVAVLGSLAAGWFLGSPAPWRGASAAHPVPRPTALGSAGAAAALALVGVSLSHSAAGVEVSQRGSLAGTLARVANPTLPLPVRVVDPTHSEP